MGGPDKKLVSVGTRRLNMAVVALKIAFLLQVSSSEADIVVFTCDWDTCIVTEEFVVVVLTLLHDSCCTCTCDTGTLTQLAYALEYRVEYNEVVALSGKRLAQVTLDPSCAKL